MQVPMTAWAHPLQLLNMKDCLQSLSATGASKMSPESMLSDIYTIICILFLEVKCAPTSNN